MTFDDCCCRSVPHCHTTITQKEPACCSAFIVVRLSNNAYLISLFIGLPDRPHPKSLRASLEDKERKDRRFTASNTSHTTRCEEEQSTRGEEPAPRANSSHVEAALVEQFHNIKRTAGGLSHSILFLWSERILKLKVTLLYFYVFFSLLTSHLKFSTGHFMHSGYLQR